MELLQQSVRMLWFTPDPMAAIASAARLCYKSGPTRSDDEMVRMLIKHGHEAMLEHAVFSFEVVTDIGISREQMRHRIASYAEMSTRYVDFCKKVGIRFIEPSFKSEAAREVWLSAMRQAEKHYAQLISLGEKPQMARSVLPLSAVTEYRMTVNGRSLRNFIKLRTAMGAHPQMRELANAVLRLVRETCPALVEDL